MPGKLNVYDLGVKGVQRVKTPVHVVDGELLSAQNAVVNVIGGLYGLGKRPGLGRLTTNGAAAGAILALTNIPFADPLPVVPPAARSLYVHRTDAGALTALSVSEDGTTWEDASLSPGGTLAEGVMDIADQVAGAVGFKTAKTRYWDGAIVTDILANAPAARLLLAHDTFIYYSQVAGDDRDIYYWTPSSPGDYPYLDWPLWDDVSYGVSALGFLDDDVFVGAYDTFGDAGDSVIHHWDGASWTQEAAWPIAGGIRYSPGAFAAFDGAMYAVRAGDNGLTATGDDEIWVRSAGGIWSALAAQISAQNASHFAVIAQLIDIDGTLFAVVNEHYDGVPTDDTAYVYRYTGASWVEDLAAIDVVGDVSPPALRQDRFGRAVSFSGECWITVHAASTDVGDQTGRLLRRAPNGVWTNMTPVGWNLSDFLAAF